MLLSIGVATTSFEFSASDCEKLVKQLRNRKKGMISRQSFNCLCIILEKYCALNKDITDSSNFENTKITLELIGNQNSQKILTLSISEIVIWAVSNDLSSQTKSISG